jgi:hypothetical protein
MGVKDFRDGFLLSGVGTGVGVTGTGRDCHNAANFAYLEYASWSPSAILVLQVSHDNTGWMTFATVTATPTTGTAQISAFLPYVRAIYSTGYSVSASAVMYYSPGIMP